MAETGSAGANAEVEVAVAVGNVCDTGRAVLIGALDEVVGNAEGV
jgi:hypothetical protein